MTEPAPQTFKLRDWLQLLTLIAGVVGVVVTALGWAFLQWSEWKDVPERMARVEQRLASIGSDTPEVILFKGAGQVAQKAVRPGDAITVVYVLRRTIDCQTEVRVRFYSYQTNLIPPSLTYSVPAVRAPVSEDYTAFAVQVSIPKHTPPGTYSYFPEIVPRDCGVYGAVVPPMSEPFEVVAP